jgi:hypothetical protein
VNGSEMIIDCDQCHGTGQLRGGQRCPCREEDDTASERRKQMAIEPRWKKRRGQITTDPAGVQWTNMGPMRPELPELPRNMKDLPVDDRGFPVPWFVDWIGGKPEFRAMDRRKLLRAVRERLCWVCGKKLWREMVFVIGPMCSINLISSEPPSHRECALFSARGCPFLSRPHMHRREDGLGEEIRHNAAGIMIDRNPGATLLWYTYRYEVINVPAIPSAGARAGILFRLGRAFKVEWYCKGRPATRAEVMQSIDSGLPLLYEANRKQGITDDSEVNRLYAEALRLVPHD